MKDAVYSHANDDVNKQNCRLGQIHEHRQRSSELGIFSARKLDHEMLYHTLQKILKIPENWITPDDEIYWN